MRSISAEAMRERQNMVEPILIRSLSSTCIGFQRTALIESSKVIELRDSPISAAVHVFKADYVILTKVRTALHLYELKGNLSGILKAMHRT